jgi:hypothetical protein
MYSIQHYVVKFVSDLRQAGGFLRTEILLKVALNKIALEISLKPEAQLKSEAQVKIKRKHI